jgi:hypothetical protein
MVETFLCGILLEQARENPIVEMISGNIKSSATEIVLRVGVNLIVVQSVYGSNRQLV